MRVTKEKVIKKLISNDNNKTNDFQRWLMSQGYSRINETLEWIKDGKIISGKELFNKLNEWKILKQ